ncbi:MAG: hypothetical protein FWD61_17540 [Phycisphaerales bacterium]|nr:hypothetical protein [Phycisphaerales bacterium]
MTLGIITGLIAALCQSLCYLATRYYVQKRAAGASRQLLVLGHLWMGVFSLIVLPFVWHGGVADIVPLLSALVCAALFYLVGQFALLIALKHTEPSRVSPLLGFKIIVLAVMASFMVQPHVAGTPDPVVGLTAMQWVGVVLCCVAAVALNFSGGRLRRRAIAAIVFACVVYSLSDWNIAILVSGVQNMIERRLSLSCSGGVAHVRAAFLAPFCATALTYLFTGLIAAGFFPASGARDKTAWRDAVPWAAAWFLAMIFLYMCFGLIGPVLGNILQSSRGVMSILIGSLLVYRGHLHIEPFHGRRVFVRRLAAGVLMFAAVILYAVGK